MKQKIIIVSEEHRSRAMEILKNLPLDPKHELVVRESKRDRSVEQNRTMWLWFTIIGASLGESKEGIAEQCKDKYLVQIYTRDNAEYAEMISSIRKVYSSGMKTEAIALRKKIVSLTTTTTATVAQMSEYLESISQFATSLAIRLPFPED